MEEGMGGGEMKTTCAYCEGKGWSWKEIFHPEEGVVNKPIRCMGCGGTGEKIQEPHHCSVCDDYGYLVKFTGWDTPISVGFSMEHPDRKCLRDDGTHSHDIPCPDCNA